MAVSQKGNAAFVQNGDMKTLMISLNSETRAELRSLLAKTNALGIGEPSASLRQLLTDIETVLQSPPPRSRATDQPF